MVLPPWSRGYDRDAFACDLSAGLTTAVMLVPQAMAYALLAGLPPIVGLYASTVPLAIYALLGTSRQLAVGPMAMASLLVATGLNELLPPDASTDLVVGAAVLATLLAGALQIAMGTLRLGGLVGLLSHPVVSGFTTAAALLIGLSQLGHVFGFAVPRGLSLVGELGFIASHLNQTVPAQAAVAGGAIAIRLALGRFAPKAPAALSVVLLGVAASWLLDLQGRGVAVLGSIPSGLPMPAWPSFSLAEVRAVLPMALTVALVGFMESISAAKVYARENGYQVLPGRELVALGSANVVSSLFGGYLVGGALSRTAVNAQAGARTPLANVVTAVAVGATLLFLTPLFAYLPTAVLAAIILVAVARLIDVPEAVHLWRVKRDDLALLLLTFLATLLVSIEAGILTGVVASLLWLVYCSTRPEVASLGRIEGTRSYRSIDHFPQAETYDRIVILRMDAQFFFGNVASLRDGLFQRLDAQPEAVGVVLDASSMNALDSTAADVLFELVSELRGQHIEIFISHLKGSVLAVMRETGLLELLGEGHVYYETDDAVQAALRHREQVDRGLSFEEEDFGTSDYVD